MRSILRRLIMPPLVACAAAPGEAADAVAQMPPGVVRDPAAARVVYDDLDRFATVYRRLDGARDTVALLDSAYLDHASDGLRIYSIMYDFDAPALAAAMRRHPDRYATTAATAPAAVRDLEPAVRETMTRLRELYPAAVFPPIHYLVGPQRAGGAVQREGVLIAVETYALPMAREERAPEPPGREPGPRQPEPFRGLVHLVAHELVHYQQAAWNPELYQRANTLLARAIREGVADFLAELVSGDHINAAAHAYGSRHERALWERFRRDMHGTETGDWFFATPADPDWPPDLGYYIGYRIARSRFLRDDDPAAGVAALIRVADPVTFLAESGYDPPADPSAPPPGDSRRRR